MFYKQNWKPRGRGPRRVGEAIWPGDGDRVGEEKICRGGEFGAGAPSPPNPRLNCAFFQFSTWKFELTACDAYRQQNTGRHRCRKIENRKYFALSNGLPIVNNDDPDLAIFLNFYVLV